MIILIGSEKGGAGKTTVATNIAAMLAVNGRDVLLLDTDTQATSTDWGALRDENADLPRVTVLQKTGAVNREVAKLVSKYCSQKQVPPSEEVFRRCSMFRALDQAEG